MITSSSYFSYYFLRLLALTPWLIIALAAFLGFARTHKISSLILALTASFYICLLAFDLFLLVPGSPIYRSTTASPTLLTYRQWLNIRTFLQSTLLLTFAITFLLQNLLPTPLNQPTFPLTPPPPQR